ncbi:TetR/AcrR family transcriptional regulator C-terminal domain-containing protein [Microbacterium stercoris]|uniref:TetR/AcrR family transcriptional regulator C-terminal domain-containing protein n=1 Tax=Microbacterium stercoris TaxID=2820289 RepID=A0A939TTH4_9MICO|nr:TetR/AcrR family transcriptional regulator C-terminal domain-containing protein [Microbacterium stercoris]MBO3662984.1 TetR/AcrR family transcriptional regulator C-terminal domain-containing protein [Microbacterium stercoris]
MSTAGLPLDRDRVLDAAISLADDAGLDGLTMRRLGQALGVTPMALYKHVANREELIDGMVERIVAAFDVPKEEGDWARELRARILAARAAITRHAWAHSAIETRTMAGAAVLAHMDALMDIMFRGGLSADLVHHAMHALSTRMWGFTRDVMPTPSLPADPSERAAALAEYAESYPAIIRLATTAPHAGAACDEDAEFTFALDILLDGFARLHHTGWRSAPGE